MTTTGPAWLTIGAIVAVVVLVLAILGILAVIPDTPAVVFGLIAALAIARLV